MPHAAVRLVDGVNLNRTPALNQAAVSTCNQIRYKADNGAILVEKLGGWTRFFPNTMTAVVRALWAWEDTIGFAHLGVGTQNLTGTYGGQLSVITDGSQQVITPTSAIDNISPVVSTNSGSAIVTITDTTITDISAYDSVYIPFHISIGGLILYGLYACDPDGHSGSTTYTIQAVDALGNPLPASSSSTSPAVASFTTVSGSAQTTIVLDNHGYNVGADYPILAVTSIGGITFYNHYPVFSVTDANTFIIIGNNNATSSTTASINGGNARFIYSFSGTAVIGSGYGVGGYGTGGYGSGSSLIASGLPIDAPDWTIDNWGEIMIACPIGTIGNPVVLTATGASGTGSVGTITFPQTYTVPIGTTVTVSQALPTSWNGTYPVTSSTANSISFSSTNTAAITGSGIITVNGVTFQPIYFWDSEAGQPFATVIPTAPPVNDGVFTAMPQRQLIAWGSTFNGISDPLLLRWCDVDNYNTWIGTVTNQAGSFRLSSGSRIVAGIQGPGQQLIWTDIGIWTMQYVGGELVYSTIELGRGCGLIARKAAGILNGIVYWMAPSQFYTLSADGVQPITCPIWDVIFQDLDQTNLQKIRFAANSRFNEVEWFYPVAGGNGEVSAYVKYNAQTNLWDYGTFGRSAWIDQSVLGPPIGADPASLYLYQHETSPDADGQAMTPSFQTGYYAMSDGDWMTFVDQFWPDMKWGYYGAMQNATVSLTFYACDYPGQTPRVYGPFTLTVASTFVTPRIRGRLVSIAMSSSDVGSFWRCGLGRYRFQNDGRF